MMVGSEILVHFASAGVSPKIVNNNEMISTNVLGTAHLIECAVKANIKRIILVGSCLEYGEKALSDQPIKADACRAEVLLAIGFGSRTLWMHT